MNHAIYGVLVPGREEGFYLFADLHDAEGFADAISDQGGFSELTEELLYDHHGTKELIGTEAVAASGKLALFS